MADITITKTAEDAASKAIRVTIPVDRVQAAERKAVREYGRRAKLPGFRQGKAPEAVVRKRFAPAIRQWVIEEVVREGWEQAREAESLEPVADPSIRNLRYEDGQPVEFELLVEVRPELTLERVGGFTVPRAVEPVTEAAVDEQLEQLRESRAAWIPVEGEKPAPGTMVRVAVASLEDGVAGETQPYSIVIGEGQAVPALEERIMELVPGQTAEAEIRYPDDHPDPARRGALRRVQVTLEDVKRQELPPLDDTLAQSVGDFNDLPALRAAVRADLERAAERDADQAVRESLVRQVVEANNVEAPPSLVQRALHAYLHAYEIPHERAEQFYTEFRPVAVAQVQRELVLSTLARREQLHATEAEVDARLAALAERRGVPPAELYASLQKNNRLNELERAVTEEKVFAYLLSQSQVEERKS